MACGVVSPPRRCGVVCPPAVWCSVLVGCGFPCGVVVGVGFRVCTRAPCGAVVGFGLFNRFNPPLPPCGVVWRAVVVGGGFQVYGLHPHSPLWVVGLFRV